MEIDAKLRKAIIAKCGTRPAALYFHLCRILPDGSGSVKQRDLAEMLGVGRRSIVRYVSILTEKDMIRVTEQHTEEGGKDANYYELLVK